MNNCPSPSFIEATGSTGQNRITTPILYEHEKHFGKVWMTPDEFFCFQPKPRHGEIDVSTPESFGKALKLSFDKDYVLRLRNRMCSNEPLDPGWLDIDVNNGKIVGHEGRTRSWVAKQLGITRIPIIIIPKYKYHYIKDISDNEKQQILSALTKCGISKNRVERCNI